MATWDDMAADADVTAVFRPRRTDDLRDVMSPWIGQELVVTCVGVVEDSGSPYFGERQWMPVPGTPGPAVGWIPESDLAIAEAR